MERGVYREAVSSQSPGLLQPWVRVEFLNNPERVATIGTRRSVGCAREVTHGCIEPAVELF
jgi:hypothetical protein